MKKKLTGIPNKKREELKKVIKHIRLHCSKTEMVILFGSYARGEWTNDKYTAGRITYEYNSDFDILAVVRDAEAEQDVKRWSACETAIHNDKCIETDVELIPESIDHINEQLEKGRYFYRDIQKEGIMLYDSGKYRLTKPKELSSRERKQLAEEDYKLWMEKASQFFEMYQFSFKKEWLHNSAFLLHQTVESLMVTACLVFTTYRPKSHDLDKLHRRAMHADDRFGSAFVRETLEEKRLFKLLRKAYVDARYEPRTYKITKEELLELKKETRKLFAATEEICQDKIGSLV